MILRLTEDAQADLKEIIAYSRKNFGAAQASRYRDGLADGLKSLRRFPEIGAPLDEIRPGYRCFQIALHRVFYRVEGEIIAVIAILHESQLPKLHLARREDEAK